MKPSLHSQAQAVETLHTYARRRGSPSMKPKEWEILTPRLGAAFITLALLQSWRDRLAVLAPEFVRNIEGGE